jgi:hypothetical protein
MSPEEFREDMARSRDAIWRACGRRVVGHRVPHFLGPRDLWAALDILVEQGYVYDSSIRPIFRKFASQPWRWVAHQHRHGDGSLWEFPLSSYHALGFSLPIAGGNWFRQLPHTHLRQFAQRS